MSASDFDQTVDRYHAALREFVRGNPEPNKKIFSHEDDVILFNPHIFISRGWAEVERALDSAASKYTDGEALGFENLAKVVTSDVAYLIEVEKYEARIMGGSESPIELRVTSIFRREVGEWKMVHRHAVPATAIQSVESVKQKQRY